MENHETISPSFNESVSSENNEPTQIEPEVTPPLAEEYNPLAISNVFKDGNNDPEKFQDSSKYIELDKYGDNLPQYLKAQSGINTRIEEVNQRAQEQKIASIGTPEMISLTHRTIEAQRLAEIENIRLEGGAVLKDIYDKNSPMRENFNDKSLDEPEPEIEP